MIVRIFNNNSKITEAVRARHRPKGKKIKQESPKNPGKSTGRAQAKLWCQTKVINKQAGLSVRLSRGIVRVEAKSRSVGTQAGRMNTGSRLGKTHMLNRNRLATDR